MHNSQFDPQLVALNEQLVRDNTDRCKEIVDLTNERNQLLRWKAEQFQVESQWNPQNIGKLLSLPLGVDIRSNIQPAIEKLQQERDELRAKLEQSQKQNAAMRTALKRIWDGGDMGFITYQGTPTISCGCCRGSGADRESIVHDEGCDVGTIYPAISTDAGRDYIHRSTVKPLVEALEKMIPIIGKNSDSGIIDPEKYKAAIAREALATYNTTLK